MESVWGITAVGPILGIGPGPGALNANWYARNRKIIHIQMQI